MWWVRIRRRWSEGERQSDHSQHYKEHRLILPGPDRLDELDLSDRDDNPLDSPLSEENTPSAWRRHQGEKQIYTMDDRNRKQ